MGRRPDSLPLSAPERNARVYAVVRGIPNGRVTTYGHIALLLGMPRAARQVGRALREIPPDLAWGRNMSAAMLRVGSESDARGTSAPELVPWHRVVNAGGRVSPRSGSSIALHVVLLRTEGVNVADDGALLDGLTAVGWFPDPVEFGGSEHRSGLLFD